MGERGHGEPLPHHSGVARALRGWNNPLPISISLQFDEIAPLREGIQRDLAALVPRCEALERSLPEATLRHRGYIASKVHHEFSLDLGYDAAITGSATVKLSDSPPCIRRSTIAEVETLLSTLPKRTKSVLTVGGIWDTELQALLRGRSIRVTPSDGALTTTPSGQGRPAANSLSTWMATHDETERASLAAIVLGRAAGRADVDLLRHRVYDNQSVVIEAGSAALPWMLALWDGSVQRQGDVFSFTKPGYLFREPTEATHLSSAVEWPRISVVTVSYNQRDYLEQCLRSVLEQNYPNLEFIVIDAGSTDGSIDILRQYESRLTRLVIEPDEGQSDGLNKGFRLATGDILTWVNSDDMLAPLALKRAALAFAESGADLVAGTCSRIAGVAGKLLYRHHAALPTNQRVAFKFSGPLDWSSSWEKGDYFFQPEVFFTRDIWERAGGYLKPHLYWAMDWDLWLRCALAGASIIRIPDLLGVSRVHTAQKTTSDEMYLWQIASILREYDDMLARLERDAVQAA